MNKNNSYVRVFVNSQVIHAPLSKCRRFYDGKTYTLNTLCVFLKLYTCMNVNAGILH